MSARTIQQMLADQSQRDRTDGVFELESANMLEVRLAGRIWAKAGSMVAYLGGVKFTREGILEQGLGTLLKKAVSGEGMTLMKMEGSGRVYLADRGKKVHILALQNEEIVVNGNDVLAVEDTLSREITMMRRIGGMMAGGLFNVRLGGTGQVAITTHYDPLALRVPVNQPLYTDPNATVAWAGTLAPDIHVDMKLGALFGRGSGESVQLKFQGEGWVLIQPYEEVYFQQQQQR